MSKTAVMHVVDTLSLGGAERAAVDLVNHLPREIYRPYLCTTRREGPLVNSLASDVSRLVLDRGGRFDTRALGRLVKFIRRENIAILHAHGSSLFIATLAAAFGPFPAVIWHAHYGRFALEDRRAWFHRLAIRRTEGVIAVSHPMVEWCGRKLAVPLDRIWYVPNMVSSPNGGPEKPVLPGVQGSRIVCVANLRAEKDHPNLIRAMALVVREHPEAHLVLVGADANRSAGAAYLKTVTTEIDRHSLRRSVTRLGERQDVPVILSGCDIGVLSSRTEGLPVSLLEYGMAGLPVVATRVGQCEEVLDQGRAGIVVSPESPDELAQGILSLLRSPEKRAALGQRFQCRVRQLYSASAVIEQVCRVYNIVLERRGAAPESAQATPANDEPLTSMVSGELK